MKSCHEVQSIDGILESLDHGETLTKFVAVDKGNGDDFTVTLHGFVTDRGECIIASSIVEKKRDAVK